MVKKESAKKNKHLTAEDRIEIEECLGKRMTFKAIGRLIARVLFDCLMYTPIGS